MFDETIFTAENVEIKEILFDLTAWDERMPMCMRVACENKGTLGFVDLLVGDIEEIKKNLDEIFQNRKLERETRVILTYRTSSEIPLKTIVSTTGTELGYFRFKPEYGITFLPAERVSDETMRQYLASAFLNAEDILREDIVDVLVHLISKL